MSTPDPFFSDLTFSEWLTEKRINQLQIEFDSFIEYLRKRERGTRQHKSLILKRMKAIREWLEILEDMLKEGDRRLPSQR